MEDSKYWSRCCGIITSWEFHALATGTLELMVWRRVAGTEWMITGKNRIYVSCEYITFVYANDRLYKTLRSLFSLSLICQRTHVHLFSYNIKYMITHSH